MGTSRRRVERARQWAEKCGAVASMPPSEDPRFAECERIPGPVIHDVLPVQGGVDYLEWFSVPQGSSYTCNVCGALEEDEIAFEATSNTVLCCECGFRAEERSEQSDAEVRG